MHDEPADGQQRLGRRATRWSSNFAVYSGTIGAAVGLGSIWRFPYLAGSGGGSAFILVFALACVFIATPLLASEFALGRASRSSPPSAAGVVAARAGLSIYWSGIGILGSAAAFLIFSYYSVIAGWILAFAWKSAVGELTRAGPEHVADLWHRFRSHPAEVAAWHAGFVTLVAGISACGLQKGIEVANRYRGPALLTILLVLVIYALATGNVQHGLAFAFIPNLAAIDTNVILAAIGQAFYATGVGQGMMIAYGSYIDRDTPLVQTSLLITASILVVSLLATVAIFPLVFAYGVNPAQGPQLVFEVLPRVFTEMPGGRIVGTLFFTLLIFAALMPSIALLEPAIAWSIERWKITRPQAVWIVAALAWLLGLGSVFSFNTWANWFPVSFIPIFEHKTFFEVLDYTTANILLPLGAVLTSVLVGWRLPPSFFASEFSGTSPGVRRTCVWLLRVVCPLCIVAVFVVNLAG